MPEHESRSPPMTDYDALFFESAHELSIIFRRESTFWSSRWEQVSRVFGNEFVRALITVTVTLEYIVFNIFSSPGNERKRRLRPAIETLQDFNPHFFTNLIRVPSNDGHDTTIDPIFPTPGSAQPVRDRVEHLTRILASNINSTSF